MKNADPHTGVKVADTIKNDHFWDEVENIVQMIQLTEKITNIASNKYLVIRLKSMSLI